MREGLQTPVGIIELEVNGSLKKEKCTGYFSHCCDEMADRSNREERAGLAHGLVLSCEEGRAVGVAVGA